MPITLPLKISVIIPHSPGREESLQRTIDSMKEHAFEFIVVEDKPRKEQVTRVNEGMKKAKGNVLFLLSDTTAMRKGWFEVVKERMNHIDYSGVVSLNGSICGLAFVTRDFYENELGGNYYWPEYIHYHADQELGERARAAMKFCEGEYLYDIYPKPDMNSSQEFVQWDWSLYHERANDGFPNTWRRTKKARTEELKKHTK